jgi:hypothetical protein
MTDELLFFNGIDGSTGDYLLPPMPASELAIVAAGDKMDRAALIELEHRKREIEGRHFVIAEGYDPLNLAEAGWGVIFPAIWEDEQLAAVKEALGELLAHRKKQAGDTYKEYSGLDGYKPGEKKDEFTSRHGAGPGDVNPEQIPYYLLIVGDPESIPYQFQYELDVAYAVGRIQFDTLDEYACYARSVVTAETSDTLKLKREAVFFPVANPNDQATRYSTDLLIAPLAERSARRKPSDERPDWEIKVLPSESCTKDQLGRLLGGPETPAFLFTASHGMGFPKDHPQQLPFQGALLCQDWPGPKVREAVKRDHYFGAEDVPSDASLLGLVSFHFACYGAGTPHYDDYYKRAFTERSVIAPHAFLSALPKRLLSHPHGGALAVVGHVERAWTYSFNWRDAGSQTTSFESTLYGIMAGKTVGLALERMNLRYAEISTMLNRTIEDAEIKPKSVSPYDIAGQWTAQNDARGYALLGDPAVRLPVAKQGEQPGERLAMHPVEVRTGRVPPIPLGEAETQSQSPLVEAASAEGPAVGLPPGTESSPSPKEAQKLPVQDVPAGGSSTPVEAAMDFASLGDMAGNIRQSLSDTLKKLADSLAKFADNISTLEVVTYTSDRLEDVTSNVGDSSPLKRFTNASPRAWTRISLDGDTVICVPTEAGEIDQSLWEIHVTTVQQAQTNRTEMIKAAAEVIASLLPKGS